jgi:prevent-host-death family protein
MFRLFKRWSGLTRQAGQVRRDQPVCLAQYNTYEARALFSDLLRRVRRGEEIVIAHAGHPVAVLTPYREEVPRQPGVIHARVVIDTSARERDRD